MKAIFVLTPIYSYIPLHLEVVSYPIPITLPSTGNYQTYSIGLVFLNELMLSAVVLKYLISSNIFFVR